MTVLSEAVLADPVALTRALCDIPSVSRSEAEICDEVEAALKRMGHLTTERVGNTLVARTDLGRGRRVMLAGHLDTVPVNDNFPTRLDGDVLWGLGTSDMKSGTALALWIAATVTEPKFDLSFAFYDCEEIEAEHNGLNKLAKTRPELLAADFAILLEPTYGLVEAGCQGTMRARVTTRGKRAHSARSWKGENAIHKVAAVLDRLNAYEAREVDVDGCTYREGLNAVFIGGGVAGNVIPDECLGGGELPLRARPRRGRRRSARPRGLRRLRGRGLRRGAVVPSRSGPARGGRVRGRRRRRVPRQTRMDRCGALRDIWVSPQ